MGCCQVTCLFTTPSLSFSFAFWWWSGPWEQTVKFGMESGGGQWLTGLCPSHRHEKTCTWLARPLMDGTAFRRTRCEAYCDDGGSGLGQNCPCQVSCHAHLTAHLITLGRQVSLLRGTIYGSGLIPWFQLFIKWEVTKQLNSVVFRQKVEKG